MTASATPSAHVALDGVPNASSRAWLHALSRAGVPVRWSARDTTAIVVSASSLVDPVGGVRVDAAAPTGARVAFGDALALGDTARAQGVGTSIMLPAFVDTLVARVGSTTARVVGPTQARLGSILVLGRAGWEAKFVAAAIEERGWKVQLRLSIAPGLAVTQAGITEAGSIAPDTSSVSAVVVLDSGVVDANGAASLARYVRSGGGVVLAGDAAGSPSLTALAVGRPGAMLAAPASVIDGPSPRRGLTIVPIESPRADAIVLERRDGDPSANAPIVVAARRIGNGRAAQVGYVDTWRWRMAARDPSPSEHRAWWARVIGAVAYAPSPLVAAGDPLGTSPADPAPYVSAVAELGAPSVAPGSSRGTLPAGRWPSDGVLAVVAGAALLGEVASRRMRGAR